MGWDRQVLHRGALQPVRPMGAPIRRPPLRIDGCSFLGGHNAVLACGGLKPMQWLLSIAYRAFVLPCPPVLPHSLRLHRRHTLAVPPQLLSGMAEDRRSRSGP
jgi:hypothetical protein